MKYTNEIVIELNEGKMNAFLVCLVFAFILILRWGYINSKEEKAKEERKKKELQNYLDQSRKEQEAKDKALREKYDAIAKEYKDYASMDVEVKGIFARSARAKDIVPTMTVDDDIKLKKEPTNQYDPFAVKVMYDRIHLGYVPADDSKFITGLIDKKSIKKVVVKFAGDSRLEPWNKPDPYLILTIYYEE